jgi:hypothetical protein
MKPASWMMVPSIASYRQFDRPTQTDPAGGDDRLVGMKDMISYQMCSGRYI